MAVVLATARTTVLNNLNATDSSDVSNDTERHWDNEIDRHVLAVDGLVIAGINLTPGHGRQKDYQTSASVTNGTKLATHIGQIQSVDCSITGGEYAGTRASQLSTIEQIERDNRNPQALTLIPPRHAFVNNTIYTNAEGLVRGGASSVTFTATYPTYVRSSACQAPDEAFLAVTDGATARALLKEGEHEGASGQYQSYFQADMIGIGIDPQIAKSLAVQMAQEANT